MLVIEAKNGDRAEHGAERDFCSPQQHRPTMAIAEIALVSE